MERIRKRFASIFTTCGVRVNHPHQAKVTCSICLDDGINANLMFSIDRCNHRFCYECVKRHIEVRLSEGNVIRCLHYRCKSTLTFGSCVNLLTPKLIIMWQQRIKEDSIPVTKRIYCPNPRCSALMSVNKLCKSTKEARVRHYCYKCGEHFCINCKVPWHSDLSCDDYKRLGPNPTIDDIKFQALANQKLWRQCGNCHHMVELIEGCISVTCRCGHTFCYRCGAKDGGYGHGHELPPRPRLPPQPPSLPRTRRNRY